MQVFDTIALPFCTITVAAAPAKVETLHDLPDFLLPIRWTQLVDGPGDAQYRDTKSFPQEAKIALHFSDVKAPELQSNRKQTTKEMFLAPNVMAMLERAILFSLDQMHVRRKVRAHLAEGIEGRVRSYSVDDLNDASRTALATVMASRVDDGGGSTIYNMHRRVDGKLIERVVLDLGGGVKFYTKPTTIDAPRSSNNRVRGTVDMHDGIHNFYITRPAALSVFKEFVTDDVLYQAFLSALEQFDKSRSGAAMGLLDSLNFVNDDYELLGNVKKD